MATSDLRSLENKLDQLLDAFQRLVEENRLLRQENQSLAGERDALLEKNNQARTRVEALIARLKTMEAET